MQRWLEEKLKRSLDLDDADTELLRGYDPDSDTELGAWVEGDTDLADTLHAPDLDEDGETQLFTREAFAHLHDEVDGFEIDTDPTQADVRRADPITVPLSAFSHVSGDLDDDPPTVLGPPTSLLRDSAARRSDRRTAPRPLPVGTAEAPKGIDSWPAPLDLEETWPASRIRHDFRSDRTAPSLFPTPEDSGKEQRPYPPPPTPPAPLAREVPAAVTSSLVGMAVAMMMIVFIVGGLILWMGATAR